ncbi:PolC-type DNA polymerase III [Halioglobus sp. Uisw_031]|jgi:DNA polymerase-3 subunit epsilon|uniref:3'-5' exonuclease n=1 Tax=Halioglobus sp. Uisw_031 TaxID=3230977 RepID=UPI0039EBE89F
MTGSSCVTANEVATNTKTGEQISHHGAAADTVVILDFETTGLSPGEGDRGIEIGAVKIERGQVIGRFQELMYPGQRISGFIESHTGISNEMLAKARPCGEVMRDFSEFIQGFNLVAHNASFDKRFLDAEFSRVSIDYSGQFSCSMLAARRLCQHSPNHQLGSLVAYLNIPMDGVLHRALYDSEMTAKLWLVMLNSIKEQYGLSVIPFKLMQKLTKTPRHAVHALLKGCC